MRKGERLNEQLVLQPFLSQVSVRLCVCVCVPYCTQSLSPTEVFISVPSKQISCKELELQLRVSSGLHPQKDAF